MQDAEEKQPEEAPAAPKVEPRCPLPAEPAVIVTPNVAAMGGNFGCAVLSLSNLRSYRIDSKGHSFEVLVGRLSSCLQRNRFTNGISMSHDVVSAYTDQVLRDAALKQAHPVHANHRLLCYPIASTDPYTLELLYNG